MDPIHSVKHSIRLRSLLPGLLVLSLMARAQVGQAQIAPPITILHSFNTTDGAKPSAGLIRGKDGALYGTTAFGGVNGTGTVFKITPSGALTTLYTFSALIGGYYGTNADGANPFAALIWGRDGALHGVTNGGGVNGTGTVFKITPSGALTTLYTFSATDNYGNNADGAYPIASLNQGRDGQFYGTTGGGGRNGWGTVFKITPSGALTTLHRFGFIPNGAYPQGKLIQGKDGALYGTASSGGNDMWDGTVFRITTSGAVTPLYAFSGSDGSNPDAGLVQGTDGVLYGTTSGNGGGNSTVFKITTSGDLTTLYTFGNLATDGWDAEAGLLPGRNGTFYGTTKWGGDNGNGTVFQITTAGTVSTLHSFSALDSVGNNADGANPVAGLIQGKDGNLYSTTQAGGGNGVGTVFKLTMTPVITRFGPTKGPVGTSVTLTGANFTEAMNVQFGNVYVGFKINSDTSLTLVVPAGAKSAKITVTSPFGKATSSTAFKVTH